uniref:PQQ-dependent sugar dehydrogenase n=1 Tax=Pricia sp. TaxID=2268138 RepID=UPI00359440E3
MNSRFLFIFLLLAVISGCSEGETQFEKGTDSVKPDPTRFVREVLVDGLDEPLQAEFDGQGQVYWIERKGSFKRVNEFSGEVEVLAEMPIAISPAPGLIGFLLDKNFEQTRQLYLYYSAYEDNGEIIRLSRFTLNADDKIVMDSEVVLLRVPWEYPDSRHFGGGMAWDGDGNLYLSIGGDSQATQYSPLAFANPGGRGEDAARTAGNTNDLRGSILRIRPQPDGSYAIPEGNLFLEGTPKTKPEIFVMGDRNPWRLSIDSETGYLHWGEVGPDAGVDSKQSGPMGFDEFNVAREAGNYGWPFIIGNNRPYNRYDYATGTFMPMSYFDPEAPINDSPNNTGLRKLPRAKPALIAYPYKVSEEWPILGSAARSAVGGPIFRAADFDPDAPRVFPDYYEGKWLVTDYVRNWIMVISMNEERTKVQSIEPLVPLEQLSHKQPLDMDFGPSGDLYLIEYGTGNQGRLSKIRYNAGNRAPIAIANAEPLTGNMPLQVRLSHDSKDFDGDDLDYSWAIEPAAGGEAEIYAQQNPVVSIKQTGKYNAVLTVSDPTGASDTDTLEILAGNERPIVDFDIVKGNQSFYFPGKTIEYKVRVSDQKDGSLQDDGIEPDEMSVTAEYIPSGMTFEQLSVFKAEGKIRPDVDVRHLQAKSLITENNCIACHRTDEQLVGPSFMDIAQRYKEDTAVFEKLSSSIIEGSSGKWEGAATPMPPHPMLTETEILPIIDYILDLSISEEGKEALPIEGEFKTRAYEPSATGGRLARFYSIPFEMGSYLLHASYTDEGNSEVAGLELTGDDIVLLRYPLLPPEAADVLPEKGISFTPSTDDPGF